jgi:hypothetical protein
MGDLAAQETTADPPDAVEPGPGTPDTARRRRRWALGAGALGALVLVAWVAVGMNPRLTHGDVSIIPAPWAEEETDWSAPDGPRWGTWTVTDPPGDEAELMVSFVNSGPVPVALTGAADGFVIKRVQFVALDLDVGVGGETRVDAITLDPGDAVGIWQTLGFPCDATFTAGSGVGPGDIPVRARTLGLARDLSLPQTAHVTLLTGSDRRTTCER